MTATSGNPVRKKPASHFDDIDQENESSTLGMWIFLATEILFFGGLFAGYFTYRIFYPAAFAEASHHLLIPLGTLNTGILLLSSLTMVFAVYSAELDRRQALSWWLFATGFLGACFLGVKAYEWYIDAQENLVPLAGFVFEFPGPHRDQAELFFSIYFVMTGLHAFHLIIGIGLVTIMGFLARRGRFSGGNSNPVELGGLYWHFVDIIWVFLFPLFYLI